MLGYEAFKGAVLGGLKETCGGDAQVRVEKILKNNGKHYDSVQIARDGAGKDPCQAIPLQRFYGMYCDGDMGIAGCIKAIQEISEEHRDMGGIKEMVQKVMDWEQIRENIYPILLFTEENGEMLERIVSTPMLDLSVAYIYRGEIDGQGAAVKIGPQMLEAYGISKEELHRQALENLSGDGYRFWEIRRFIMEQILGLSCKPEEEDNSWTEDLYILTNTMKFYGAAGILDGKCVREFADGRDFYIIPTSIHETIFAPADRERDAGYYRDMVAFINETDLAAEDKLSDNIYFYDAGMDEIRMCA